MRGADAVELVAHAGNLVPGLCGGLDRVGIFLGGGAADEERRMDVQLVQYFENVPDAGSGAVLYRAADHGVRPIAGQ